MSAHRHPLLTAETVSHSFFSGSGQRLDVLQTVDLRVYQGEFVSLVGPSGCGKSTLLRLIAGLERPTSGTLSLDGKSIDGPSRQRGLVFQDPNLFPWLTVEQNIRLGQTLRVAGKGPKADVGAMIRLVGLAGFETAYPHQLSGGMAQRTALARTLINAPEVVLLDEPLGALDNFTRMQMQDEILKLRAASPTMLMVTHDIDEAIYMSDRIVIMSARPGKIEREIPVTLAAPRNRNDPDFLELRSRILEIFHFAHRPRPTEEVVI